ncbi:hypothetical protein N425_05085 [Tannerella sp. oral taxon BU063 isolate Cell 2]|uniref:Uncharacterized protein n=1 Tax=Tannerella sp. oral taxon BU063 isolate Cell 2 TaxID=1411148 RepID=W2C5F2_9BACT|nr:hypothetical protein N425_05085 [Tannerella sp. oral taxon BU063 isolate Cell 2]
MGSLAVGVERQPEVVWPERLFGVHFQRLEWLFAQYRSKVEGSLELLFFRSSQRVAGEIFRKGSTKSRRLSGGNIFSGYISKGWSGFSQRISQKLEAAWPECLFRAQFRRPERFSEKD